MGGGECVPFYFFKCYLSIPVILSILGGGQCPDLHIVPYFLSFGKQLFASFFSL